MKKLFTFFAALLAAGSMWAEAVTVGMTVSLSETSLKDVTPKPESETFTSATNLVVTRAIGESASVYSTGDKGVNFGSGTSYYSTPCYKNGTSYTSYQENQWVGYKVEVAEGYKFQLSRIDATMAASANVTWKVVVEKEDGTTIVSTNGATPSNYKTSTTGLAQDSTFANQDWITGTFYVKAYYYFNGTGKYLTFPKLNIEGTVEGNVISSKTIYLNPIFDSNDWSSDGVAIFANVWGGGDASASAVVKMEKVNDCDAAFKAEIPASATMVQFVRCHPNATEVIFDGEGKNVYNKAEDHNLSTTVNYYKITGWSNGGYSTSGVADETANFAPSTYTITYAAGEHGTGTMEPATVECGGNYTTANCTFTPVGNYIFAGWKNLTALEGEGDFEANEEISDIRGSFTLTAQWEKHFAPTTLFTLAVSNTEAPATNGAVTTATGGSVTAGTTNASKAWGLEGATYDNSVPSDMKVAKGLKSGSAALYLKIGLNEELQAGDTVFFCGFETWVMTKTATDQNTDKLFDAVTTGTDKNSYKVAYVVLDEKADGLDTVYVWRGAGSSAGLAAIKITRPNHGDVQNVEISGLTVNEEAVTPVPTAVENVITLAGEFTQAPTVVLTTTNTYEDGFVGNEKVTVTLTLNGEETAFEGTATLGETTYTVKANKDSRVFYTITFDSKDGSAVEPIEVVAGEVANKPADPTREHYLFLGWKENNANFDWTAPITDNHTLTATWSKVYSNSVDLELFVVENNQKANWKDYFDAFGIVAHNCNELDSLDANKPNNNYPYLGLKMKNQNDAYISAMIRANQYVILTVGHMEQDGEVQFNEQTVSITGSDTKKPAVYTFEAAATDRTFKFFAKGTGTCVLKSIQIVSSLTPTYQQATTGAANWGEGNSYTTTTAQYTHGTICLPYNADVTGAVVYEYQHAEYDNEGNVTGLVFDFPNNMDVNNALNVEAGKAYVYYATEDNQVWTKSYGENPAEDVVVPETVSEFKLVGTYSEIELEEGNYFLYTEDDKFHPACVAPGQALHTFVNVPAFRAYIPELPGITSNAPIRMILPKEEVATGVENVADYKAAKAMVDGKIVILRGGKSYNVAGALLK